MENTHDRPIAWNTDYLRLTAFLVDAQEAPEEVWSSVVGGEPEAESTQRSGGAKAYVAENAHGDGYLTMYVQSKKVDWVYATRPALHAPIATQFMCSLDESLRTFGPIIDQVLGSSPPEATRLAFGAVLMYPVDSREEGYSFVDSMLPHVTLDPAGSSDFVYRINRRRPSKVVTGLPINRLSEWIVARIPVGDTAVPLPGDESSPGTMGYAGRLSLDINTAPEWSEPFDADTQTRLLPELRDLAIEIAQSGDIA